MKDKKKKKKKNENLHNRVPITDEICEALKTKRAKIITRTMMSQNFLESIGVHIANGNYKRRHTTRD